MIYSSYSEIPIGCELDSGAYWARTLSFVLQVSNPIVGLSAAVFKIWLTEDTYVPSCPTSPDWNFTAFCCRICQ